jgi:hypothetical protein
MSSISGRIGWKDEGMRTKPWQKIFAESLVLLFQQWETAASICLFMVFDASRPRCKLAVREELQKLYFLANLHKDMML